MLSSSLLIPLVIAAVAIVILIKILRDTRGICFFSGSNTTDSEKMVRMAQEIRFFSWPSRMHRISYGRGQLREYWVLGLRLVGRFHKNKISDHLNVSLASIANGVSTILIYWIASHLTNPYIGAFCALLYATSFWPYQVAIYMGHIHLAQTFFLSAILALERASASGPSMAAAWTCLSGMLCAASFVSSSASRKYPPMYVLAFLAFNLNKLSFPFVATQNRLLTGIIVLVSGLTVVAVGKALSTNLLQIVERRVPTSSWSKDTREKYRNELESAIRKSAGLLTSVLLVMDFIVKDSGFVWMVASAVLGVFVVSLHILLPDFLTNVNRYREFLNIGVWANHFKSYKGREMEIFGRIIPDNFRGGGTRWVPLYLWRMAPFACILYVASLVAFACITLGTAAADPASFGFALLEIAFFTFLSLLPLIIAEATHSLQVGKSYFPGFAGLILMVMKGTASFHGLFGASGVAGRLFIGFFAVTLLLQIIHSIRVYSSDILPARMAPTHIREFLRQHKISRFATYDNPYNMSLVQTMLYSYPGEFEVTCVESIRQAANEYFVVPCTSSKSVTMETQQYAIQNGDFDKDPALNELMTNHQIEKLAVFKTPTLGVSRYYVHESEITSYRDLILRQITPEDRWRGHAWVLPGRSGIGAR